MYFIWLIFRFCMVQTYGSDLGRHGPIKTRRVLETDRPLFLLFGLAWYDLKFFLNLLGLNPFNPKHDELATDRPDPTQFSALVLVRTWREAEEMSVSRVNGRRRRRHRRICGEWSRNEWTCSNLPSVSVHAHSAYYVRLQHSEFEFIISSNKLTDFYLFNTF